jgi:hypothetical protein
MKNYIIECEHDIYIDSYEQGELENVNWYKTQGKYNAKNPFEAVKEHLKSLGYDFNKENSEVNEEMLNLIHYSVLVDNESNNASENQVELWEKGDLKLYSNNMAIYVYELTPGNF